jgi:hypothetical protein
MLYGRMYHCLLSEVLDCLLDCLHRRLHSDLYGHVRPDSGIEVHHPARAPRADRGFA